MNQADSAKDQKNDPLESLRAMRDAYLSAMAKTMTEAVNTEGYAQASGGMLDALLTVSAPAKEALDRSMIQALEQLSLPSRLDIISLAERFTNMELRIDDMDRKLDELVKRSRDLAGVKESQRAAAPGRTAGGATRKVSGAGKTATKKSARKPARKTSK